MAPEATKVRSTLAVDTATTRHLVFDARRAVDGLHRLSDTICLEWIGDDGRHWVDTAVRSANITWRLLTAAIRRADPTRFLARIELLDGLRLLVDEAPDLVRAESRSVYAALDDTDVTMRALRAGLSIRGRNPNPAAAARLRQVLTTIADDIAALPAWDGPLAAAPHTSDVTAPPPAPVTALAPRPPAGVHPARAAVAPDADADNDTPPSTPRRALPETPDDEGEVGDGDWADGDW